MTTFHRHLSRILREMDDEYAGLEGEDEFDPNAVNPPVVLNIKIGDLDIWCDGTMVWFKVNRWAIFQGDSGFNELVEEFFRRQFNPDGSLAFTGVLNCKPDEKSFRYKLDQIFYLYWHLREGGGTPTSVGNPPLPKGWSFSVVDVADDPAADPDRQEIDPHERDFESFYQ